VDSCRVVEADLGDSVHRAAVLGRYEPQAGRVLFREKRL
jgi:hypothetical protein